MRKTVRCFILLLCFSVLPCGCNKTENHSAVGTSDPLPYTTTLAFPEHELDTSENSSISTPLESESVTSNLSSLNSPPESKTNFDLLTRIFSMPQSEYSVRKGDFTGITVQYYDILPESIMCYDFVIPESNVNCSAGMSYDDITGQLAQFSEARLINYTIYRPGPHEYMFYEEGNKKIAVEYYLGYSVDNTEKIYRFCFVFDNNKKLSYIEIYYPSFNGINSMLNRSYFMEYSDICFKHIDDLTADDLSLLLNTKRSYIYSLYNFSSLELRSRIMNTFYYSSIGASPIVNTTVAYGSPIEGEDWKDRLEEYPLFISIEKGRLLGADVSSDFPAVRKQWGEPMHEGSYEDIRDKIVYNYMTYVFEDIMVVCAGSELNKDGDAIISQCLVLPRNNELFTSDGVYKDFL
ncbi:MAG: hypothetical protein NC203_12135 [Firmicutes bacterium]|nr:hypothetical protein [Bacillota bacterium]